MHIVLRLSQGDQNGISYPDTKHQSLAIYYFFLRPKRRSYGL